MLQKIKDLSQVSEGGEEYPEQQISIYEGRESGMFKYTETHFEFPFSLGQFITTDCFSQASPGGPEQWQTQALADVGIYAYSGCRTSS